MTKQTLFNDIYVKAGFTYLSDLHQRGNYPAIAATVAAADAGLYAPAEWNELVSYITGGASALETSQAAQAYLLSFLREE